MVKFSKLKKIHIYSEFLGAIQQFYKSIIKTHQKPSDTESKLKASMTDILEICKGHRIFCLGACVAEPL